MEACATTSGIIGYACTWDEDKGPVIVSEAPPKVIDDPIATLTQIYVFLASYHGKEKEYSSETVTLPLYQLSSSHVVLASIDQYSKESGNGAKCALFIAFIMPKSTANDLESYIPVAMQSFMQNFKQDKQNYRIDTSRDVLITYLLNKSARMLNKLPSMTGSIPYRIAVAGLPFAGKTAILRRLKTGRFFENTKPTKGFDIEILERSLARFQVMDMGGQEQYIHAFWRSFLLKSQALIFVIDISDHNGFNKARKMLRRTISWNPAIKDLLILANKKDLAGESMDFINDLDIPAVIASSGLKSCKVFLTSARTGEGLEESFRWLALQLTGQEYYPVNILSAHVFRKTGLPIVSSYVKESNDILVDEITHIDMMPPKEDTSLISGFYNAIGSFVNKVFDGRLSTVEIKGFSGKSYRLVNIEKGDLFCLLLVESDERAKETWEAIGNEVLEYISRQEKLNAPIEKNKLHSLINPFYSADRDGIRDIPGEDLLTNGTSIIRYDSYFFTSLSVMDRMRSKEKQVKEPS